MVHGLATSTLAADHSRASSLSRRAKTSVKSRETSCTLIGKPHAARRAGKETQKLDQNPIQPRCQQSFLKKLVGSTCIHAEVKVGMARSFAAVLAAASIILQPSPALAEADLYRYPASSRPEILAVQRTLLEVWAIVKGNFVDGNFNGHNWDRDLGSALMSAYDSPDRASAYEEIKSMVHGLGDPYTRIIPASEYEDFTVTSNGEMQGVGMLIAADTKSGRLMVLSPLDGSPAARAGIQPGDEVVSIDGHSVHGWDGDRAASSLRGKQGSTVNIRLARRTQQVPGIAGRPDPPLYTTYRQVNVTREKLELSPVYSTALMHDDHKVGYLRLTNFSQKAAADLKRHLVKLERNGAEAFILDLRNNPGGLVRSGLDIARIFLDGPTTIFNVTGREPTDLFSDQLIIQQKVLLEDGHSDTRRPLAVLVNHNSASASEILAGALRDNHRAVVLGDTTYGKGKIQSVFELTDGSALFVTVARYRTPLLAEIDQVGIQPDESCKLDQDDPPPLPITVEGALMIANQLMTDQCIIKAEERLEAQLLTPPELHWHPETRTWAT